MRDSAILLVHSSLLADRITSPLRNEIDPEVVVDATGSDTGKISQCRSGRDEIAKTYIPRPAKQYVA